MNKTPQTYTSCSDMPIYNFMMYIHKSNLKYFIRDYIDLDKGQVSKFISKNEEKIESLVLKIEEEYKSLTFNKNELTKQKEFARMMFIETKHNIIISILKIYSETKKFYVLEVLGEFNIFFDEKKDIIPQLEKVKNICIGLKNTLNIKTYNFKIKYNINDDDFEENKKYNSDGIEKSLDNQALVLESNLETGYRIDTKKTSIIRWVNLLESNEMKLLQQNI